MASGSFHLSSAPFPAGAGGKEGALAVIANNGVKLERSGNPENRDGVVKQSPRPEESPPPVLPAAQRGMLEVQPKARWVLCRWRGIATGTVALQPIPLTHSTIQPFNRSTPGPTIPLEKSVWTSCNLNALKKFLHFAHFFVTSD